MISITANTYSPARLATVQGLRAGLGVEDIALRSRQPISFIRKHVADLRKEQKLQALYAAAKVARRADA